MRRVLKALAGIVGGTVLVLVTVLLLRGFDARGKMAIRSWHSVVPAAELHASEMDASFTLAKYLAREEVLFREVRDRVEKRVPPEDRYVVNRFWAEGPLCPANFPRDWNRTFEMVPAGEVRGGVLLVHGLTDAPYSMRRLAEIYRDLGYYALALRVPGHGTVPGALTEATWQDWAAAVRMGARHVRTRAGEGKPFHLVGYSNGGALCLEHAISTVEGESVPRADRLVLVSPMVGVTPFAGFARFISRLGVFPYFEASRWLGVLPEYVPFKYNSFPANAAFQTYDLTSNLQKRLAELHRSGKIRELPPMLTFVSLVDATVLTPATVHELYDRLGENGSELVVFDLNRSSDLRPFLKGGDEDLLGDLLPARTRPWQLTVVTNADPGTTEVVARVVPPGTEAGTDNALGLSWPDGVFSLSHVALPFPPDDPLFGGRASPRPEFRINIGTLDPRGEREVLAVPVDQLMRLTWNPFFPVVEERVKEWAAAPQRPTATAR